MAYIVKTALTDAEQAAIFAFRYRVYCADDRRDRPGLDHRRGMFIEDLDDPSAIQLYVEDSGQIAAILRLNLISESLLARPISDWLRLHLFLARWPRSALGYGSRLMIAVEYRCTTLVRDLFCAAYREFRGRGVRFVVIYCRPAIASLYEQFGLFRYGGEFDHPVSGKNAPLVWVLGNRRHFRAIRSPVAQLADEFGDDPDASDWADEYLRPSAQSAGVSSSSWPESRQ